MPTDAELIRQQLATLVAMPSVSAVDPEFDMSNAQVVDCLAEWSEAAGMTVTLQDVSAAPLKRNLVARTADGGGGLVLSGHTDTVPYDTDRWATDPFELVEKDGNWYGLGSADMKCFFPIALAALARVPRERLVRPVVLLATADEESSMNGARVVAGSGTELGDYAVIGEPTQLIPIYRHKGILIGRISIEGRSGHSSNPALGTNALDCMHAVIGDLMAWREDAARRFSDTAFEVPGATLNLGRISGGDSPNRICADCELLFDIRLMPGMEIAQVERELAAFVARRAQEHGTRGELVLPMQPLAPMSTPPESPIVQALSELSGNAPRTVAFATEGPFLNALGCQSVIFGPGNIDTAHQPNEYVEIDRALKMIDIVEALITRFCCAL